MAHETQTAPVPAVGHMQQGRQPSAGRTPVLDGIAACSGDALDGEWTLGGDELSNVTRPRAPSASDELSFDFLAEELLDPNQEPISMQDENSAEFRVERVHKFVDGFNSGGVPGIMMVAHDIFHPDVILRDPNMGTFPPGDWDSVRDHWQSLMSSYDKLRVTLSDINSRVPDTITSQWHITGRHIGPSFGIEPTMRTVNLCGSATYKFRGGKMSEVEYSWSGISLLQQLLGLAGGLAMGLASGMWDWMKNRVGFGANSVPSTTSDDTVAFPASPTGSSRSQNSDMDVKQAQLPPVALTSDPAHDGAIVPSHGGDLGSYELERSLAEARNAEPWYECGYCGEQKPSLSTGADGRVRIRCACGGKHKDLKARMHANWKPYNAEARKGRYRYR